MKSKLLLGCVVIVVASLAQAADRPNVLVIMADDLGYHDLGFQGSEHIKTPNIDQLAAQGMRFTDGHVAASVCSPSRAGFITGRYQQRFGHEGNAPPHAKGMDVNERTIANAFKALGYRTAVFGKWHLGDTPEFHPNVRGFDEFYGLLGGGRNYWYNKEKSDRPDSHDASQHNGEPIKFEGHFTDWLGEKAVEFIDETKDQPFFAFLSFTAPHTPLQSKPEDMEALGLPKNNYAGLIYGMDRNIGYVIEALKRSGKLENTLIWFLSDNGGIAGQSSNAPLSGKKGYKFEGGQRVPFLLYWKGRVPAGKEYGEMVSSLDIFATSVKASGGSLKQERPLDGVDLMPYITGKQSGIPHRQLYWRKLDCAALRDGDWKLIRIDNYGFALYNLKDDLEEQKDLAAKMPEKVQQLQKMMEAWEEGLMEPLWSEGEYWAKERFKYHTTRFKNGHPPVKK